MGGSRGSQESTAMGLFERTGFTTFLRAIFLGIFLAYEIALSNICWLYFLSRNISFNCDSRKYIAYGRLQILTILIVRLKGTFSEENNQSDIILPIGYLTSHKGDILTNKYFFSYLIQKSPFPNWVNYPKLIIQYPPFGISCKIGDIFCQLSNRQITENIFSL